MNYKQGCSKHGYSFAMMDSETFEEYCGLCHANEKRTEAIATALAEIEKEVVRLKELGWTQKDFASALKKLLTEQ